MLAKRSSVPAGSSSSSTDDEAQHNLHTWKALNSSSLEKKNGKKRKKRNWKRVLGREALVRLQQNQRVGRVLKVSAEDKNACADFLMKRD